MYVTVGEQMLKKAQRDIANTVRQTTTTLTQSVDNELTAAFRNFSNAVLNKEADICSVRAEYLQMPPKQLLDVVFGKLRQLHQTVASVQISWEGDSEYSVGHARRKMLQRSVSIVNNFAGHLATDPLMLKMFKVVIGLY